MASAPRRFTVPRQYTPHHLAAQILTSRAALEGERKQVTVLLADVKGSMELLADRDPEEARRLLDPILDLMMEAVHVYEGTVNQVMGDGVMALFGAPIAHEDHAVRACYAALRMQQAASRYGDEVQRSHGLPVQIRIGINSGEVVVRSIGSDLDMDYTAVGQTTHIAGRLEQMAKPGTILSSAATFRLAEGFLQGRPLGFVPIRGLSDPVEVLEIVGAEASRIRFHVAAARGLTPFVGRDEEYGTVVRAVEQAGSGRGQLVAVVGEPGVGKSRLLWEFSRSAATTGWLVLEGGGVSYGASAPYLPILTWVRRYFGIGERDSAQEIRERVTGKLLALDAALGNTLPAFFAILDVVTEDPEWVKLDPGQRRDQTNEAIKRLLVRESQAQPVLLALEDLHWIDHETQVLLDVLTDALPTARLALLVNYRPEYVHGWGSKTSYTQIHMEPLAKDSTQELLRRLLGDDPDLDPLRAALIERAGGNPFFLEESVRTLVETGALEGAPGRYRLARAVDRIQVPASVQAVLAARVDRLTPEDKRLLQAAAAIGSVVPLELIRLIDDGPEGDLRAGLARLRDAGFLHETALYPEVEYVFAHALTHDVAYAGLIQDRRRALHAKIVEAMERLYGSRLSEQVERVAYHAFGSEAWDKAVRYYRQAGAKAAARSAYHEAVACFERALTAIEHLPHSQEVLVDAIDVRFELRNSLFPLGQIGRDLENLRAAEPLAQLLGDDRRLAWIYTYMTRDLSILGQPDQAARCGQLALGLAPAVQDFELGVLTNAYMGSVCFAAGDYRTAVRLLREAVSSLGGDLVYQHLGLPGPASIFFRYWLVASLASLGEFAEGTDRANEGVQIALTADQPLARAVAHYISGFLHVQKTEFSAAILELEASLHLCRRWKLAAWFSNIASILGYAYARSRRVAEGISLMQEAIEKSVALGAMVNHSSEVARLGEVYMLSGDSDKAESLARQAIDLARVHKERGNEASALRLLAEVSSRRENLDLDSAQDLFRQAFALASDLGMKPLVGSCHAGLAHLFRRAGRSEQAQAEWNAANELSLELGTGAPLPTAGPGPGAGG